MDKRVLLAAPRATARAWRERSRSSNAHSNDTDLRSYGCYQIVHSTHVIAELEAKGAIVVEDHYPAAPETGVRKVTARVLASNHAPTIVQEH